MSLQVARGIIPFVVEPESGEIVGYQLRDGRMAYLGSPVQITGVLLGEDALAYGALINDDTVTVSGVGTPGFTAAVLVGGRASADEVVDSAGEWSATVAGLNDGEVEITVQALTPEGVPAGRSAPFLLRVDTIAPDAAAELAINEDGDTLTGVAEPGATVEAFDGDEVSLGSATAAADGAFTITLDPAQDPEAEVTVFVTDAAGNISAPQTVAVPEAPEE